MQVVLRSMTESDYPAVLSIWQQVDGLGGQETNDQFLSFLRRNPGLSQVACLGDRVVGAVLCGHDSHRGYLYRLAVLPDCCRQGIARALVERCVTHLRELGILRCSVHVLTDNRTGLEFWRAAGWRERTDIAAFSIDLEGPRP